MWQIKNPQLKPSTLDFSSSGQGKRPVWQLFADGVELINALELVDWESEETQFLVCEECGHTGCKVGDWVSVRKSDSLVFICRHRTTFGATRKTKRSTVHRFI